MKDNSVEIISLKQKSEQNEAFFAFLSAGTK